MKDVMGPGLSPSARSPRSSSRSDMVGSGGHRQEGTESLPPVELASSSVSHRAAISSLSRDNWSSFRKCKSESPDIGSKGELGTGLLSGKNLGGGEASGKVRVRACRWAFSSSSLPSMRARYASCGVPKDLGTLWERWTPAEEEVLGAGSSASEASTAVMKEATELQSRCPRGDSKLRSVSGWSRRLLGRGPACRLMSLPPPLPSAVESSVTLGGPKVLASSPFPQGPGPRAGDKGVCQRSCSMVQWVKDPAWSPLGL